MSLKIYNDKRDFTATPEPKGEIVSGAHTQRFVIQRHQASHLHYDLRLEIDGTLKSWAIPKGPSMNPSDKRLAVRTEDHPIPYLKFQGTIPKGNYGAGIMKIWDDGIFEIDHLETDKPLLEQLAIGNLKLFFHGKKIKGRFALVRTTPKGSSEQWLLLKKKDTYAIDAFYNAETLVPVTDRNIKEYPQNLHPGRVVQPMLATSTKTIFNDPNFIYELKWDGYRVIAHVAESGILLQSRNGINYNTKFSKLYDELQLLDNEVILDGEVVLVDYNGVSQFGELQNYPDAKGELRYYVFDMLYLNGHSMLDLTLRERKSLIPEVLEDLKISKYCDHVEGMGTALYQKAIEVGMEGVIAKEANSTYTLGYRTDKWLKIKGIQSLDAFICGYTESSNSAERVGSLILGTEEDGRLIYVGNCGSGFSTAQRNELYNALLPLKTSEYPFDKKISLKGRKAHFVLPLIECEVKFTERTKNGLLRNPVFKRIKSTIPTMGQEPKAVHSSTGPKNVGKETLVVDGFKVPISNLDKIYWPNSGLKKYDLIDYYVQIATYILPHLKDRPQSLHRHPNGIQQESFYQKDNENLPDWIETIPIYSKSSNRDINYLLCQNTATLLYMANLGCIEINPWSSRIQHLDYPDYGIIDLDPPKEMDFKKVVKVAKEFKNLLTGIAAPSFCKVSGSRGIHIYIPMQAAYTYEEVRNFIKLLCHVIEERLPSLTTMERTIKKREGKIYLDYLQNRKGHTIASVHSVRPIANAPISAPIYWEELNDKLNPQRYVMKTYPKRLEQEGDLFNLINNTEFDMAKVLTELEFR
ncbi:bifunctional non-homologous end joining protein LigD [Maribacter sedimenticola]|uniref:DNA ligase (ATP) n=1 Tax=Maribacter sedimenticola TaxID=228956 RepID=A0ABY1SJA5_9FLAO|nr:DNA ligase D [Maribacter sedimenticola]SNR63478.1 bifunctional non-homologous end joining protein LigD [Maribacter sedimenticola]